METIVVHGAFDEPTYSSISDAISAAGGEDTRSERARRDSSKLGGLRVRGANWTDTKLVLHLSGGASLLVFLDQPRVEWKVALANDAVVAFPDHAPDLQLIFRESGQQHTWHRTNLIAARIGHPIQRIAAGASWLYIYIADSPILLCTILRSDRDAEDILYWDDTD